MANHAITAERPAKRLRHTFWWYFKWLMIIIQIIVFCAIITTGAVLYGIYNRLNEIVPDVSSLTARTMAEPTTVWAADGTLLAQFRGDYRKWIDFDDLQRSGMRDGQPFTELGYLGAATIAVEDWRFYSHMGLDPIRIGKAALTNLTKGEVKQGGSTITEQLAINLYLTRTRTMARRVQEALLALKLEHTFSKDEILTMYLNEIYYGNNAYGCEAAAQRYFNKSAGDLSIAEAAFLAGLPNSPTHLNPFKYFDRAQRRQRIVLRAMLEREKINQTQFLEALDDNSVKEEIEAAKERYQRRSPEQSRWRSPYFVAYTKKYLQSHYNWSDEFITKSGLKIYTTLDPAIDEIAKKAMDNRLKRLSPRGKILQGALVSIDPWTGHIVALYGGRDYYNAKLGGEFDRATMAKRQPGSTFKPYIYSAAMESGYTPKSIVVDKPLKVSGHEVKNYDLRYRGDITFREALAISNNVAATRIFMKIGMPTVINKAHQMGFTSTLKPVPSLALGSIEVTLLENTSAFGVFSTKGLRAEPTPIERVDNAAGETLVEHAHPVQAARVLNLSASNEMWDMLRYVVTNGTGRPANIPGRQVIGKTGTTSDIKDVLFMGATKELVTGVWMGYDQPSRLHGATSSGWVAPAWRTFMVGALNLWDKRDPVAKLVENARATQQRRGLTRNNSTTETSKPESSFVSKRICEDSGLLATRYCPYTHIEEFASEADAPSEYCNIHQPRRRNRRGRTYQYDEDIDNSESAETYEYNDEGSRRQQRSNDERVTPRENNRRNRERNRDDSRDEAPVRRDYGDDESDEDSFL